jgi:hypothetical protein
MTLLALAGMTACTLTGQTPGTVVKRRLAVDLAGPNLLQPDAWRPWKQGFDAQDGVIACSNGADTAVERGAGQSVALNQDQPRPIVATAASRAEEVTGDRNSDYSLYLDLVYTDGQPQWGEVSAFTPGTHDWEQRQVLFMPEKPLRSASVYVLLRRHGGKAWFRDVTLRELRVPAGTATFDGVPVSLSEPLPEAGFQVCDQAAGGNVLAFVNGEAAGLRLAPKEGTLNGATTVEAEVRDLTGRDRAITLYYAVRTPQEAWSWLADPRSEQPASGLREYANTSRFEVGHNGRLSLYPFGAVAGTARGLALGLDPFTPAYSRVCYNAGTRELVVACDIALTPEQPAATVRLCRFEFEPAWGFRAALDTYCRIYPEAFRCRTPQQGQWMPFAKISAVEGWEDFGFVFKEGNNETEWDDAHGITTFRYTEPLTWWMRIPDGVPWTLEGALGLVRKHATDEPDSANGRHAKALLASGYHDEQGRFAALFQRTPWCNGAVWSMNSLPGIAGEVTDFGLKWNAGEKARLYGPERKGDLDGEYVDSSEGYVTAVLDYRRDHLAAARAPLTFDAAFRPAVFRGLIAAGYVQALAEDVHAMGKLMMANGTPGRLWFLAPHLDVMGTETDWNHGGQWRPMAHRELLYRRALCGPKPFCFLMNTDFGQFPYEKVERYMKRSLAYGMFPGFFSHNASEGHYFARPELYNRDRPLFRKYVPLVKRVAEAGWEPLTQARSEDPAFLIERFGQDYLTVFNDGGEAREGIVRVLLPGIRGATELVSGQEVAAQHDGEVVALRVRLAAEDVAVLQLRR